MKIAVLEDEAITALFLQETLEDLGHHVVGIFDDYYSILEYFKNNGTVDLLFTDIQISSNIDGIDTAKELKKIHPDISMVFITSFKDSVTIARAKELKPSGYLIKPVIESDIEAILMVVESSRETFKTQDGNLIICENYIYNKELKEIYEDGTLVKMSKKERLCLDCLMENINSYTSQKGLILYIWNGESNRVSSLRELIFRLRKKLPGLDIKSVSNTGYVLNNNF